MTYPLISILFSFDEVMSNYFEVQLKFIKKTFTTKIQTKYKYQQTEMNKQYQQLDEKNDAVPGGVE